MCADAKYGREIMAQPGMVAWQIFDAKSKPLQRDEYHIREVTRVESDTLAGLAEELAAYGVHPKRLEATLSDYNEAVQCSKDVTFNPAVLDGKSTGDALPVPKSNWALELDTPPYEAYATTCGITFTFGGLRIEPDSAAVLDTNLQPISGLFAAGELVGGLFYFNYAGGTGLMSGAVFGRAAGTAAAAAALARRD